MSGLAGPIHPRPSRQTARKVISFGTTIDVDLIPSGSRIIAPEPAKIYLRSAFKAPRSTERAMKTATVPRLPPLPTSNPSVNKRQNNLARKAYRPTPPSLAPAAEPAIAKSRRRNIVTAKVDAPVVPEKLLTGTCNLDPEPSAHDLAKENEMLAAENAKLRIKAEMMRKMRDKWRGAFEDMGRRMDEDMKRLEDELSGVVDNAGQDNQKEMLYSEEVKEELKMMVELEDKEETEGMEVITKREETTCAAIVKFEPLGVKNFSFTLFCSGLNEDGELGITTNGPSCAALKKMRWEWEKVDDDDDDDERVLKDAPKFIDVACGSMVSYGITEEFKLVTWGAGLYTGRSSREQIIGPGYILESRKIKRVVASECAGAAIDSEGNNDYFLLPNQDTALAPLDITHHFPTSAIDIAAGNNFIILLLSSGHIYGWGVTEFGSLGNTCSPNEHNDKSYPPGRRLSLPQGFKANRIYAGGLSSFVTGVWEDGRNAMLACGDNGFGQLGFGHVKKVMEFEEVELGGLRGGVEMVAAGIQHTLFLMKNGEVFGCGTNRNGELGYGNEPQVSIPVRLDLPPCQMIAAGTNGFHSYAVTLTGQILVSGANTWEQLRRKEDKTDHEMLRQFTKVETGSWECVFATGGTHFSMWGLRK
ncbi:hypothetical protein HDU67_000502 [Dinochytrium kinnereticum]|nr:hypothetical protein HDU67_000502 [Dinochytrium kinnereticum]